MKRVQIQLAEEQLAALRKQGEATGEPVAAMVRAAVDEWIAKRERDELWERALAVVGKFNSGLGDLAENHDYYLGEGDW